MEELSYSEKLKEMNLFQLLRRNLISVYTHAYWNRNGMTETVGIIQ